MSQSKKAAKGLGCKADESEAKERMFKYATESSDEENAAGGALGRSSSICGVVRLPPNIATNAGSYT